MSKEVLEVVAHEISLIAGVFRPETNRLSTSLFQQYRFNERSLCLRHNNSTTNGHFDFLIC